MASPEEGHSFLGVTTREGSFQGDCQVFEREWLLHDPPHTEGGKPINHGRPAMTGGDDHRNSLVHTAQGDEAFVAVEFRHGEVENNEIDVSSLLLEYREGLLAVATDQDLTTEATKHVLTDLPNRLVVIDKEHRLARKGDADL